MKFYQNGWDKPVAVPEPACYIRDKDGVKVYADAYPDPWPTGEPMGDIVGELLSTVTSGGVDYEC